MQCACLRSQSLSELDRAILAKNYSLMLSLLTRGENPNAVGPEGVTPLSCSIGMDDSIALQILLRSGANIHALLPPLGESLLHECVSLSKFRAAKFLLEHGVSANVVDSSGETALMYAVRMENLLAVSFLVGNGANVNFSLKAARSQETPLSVAIFNRENVGRELRMKEGSYTRFDTVNFLRFAADLGIIDTLLKAGANANVPSNVDTGLSFLHIAARECDTTIVRLLLKHGADKNAEDNLRRRPYDVAVENGCKPIEELLK